MLSEKPYWARRPQGATVERLARLADMVDAQDEAITVRALTYKMYPAAHGEDLDRAYNTTCKDAVRARVLGLVPWGSIKEERIKEGDSLGFEDADHYIRRCLNVNRLVRGFSLDRRPAHDREIETWFEKATVVGEFADVCSRYDVRYISTRGHTPWTTKWLASNRLDGDAVILYFGDNDETGREIPEVIERDLAYLAEADATETADDDTAPTTPTAASEPPTVEWCGVTADHEARFDLPTGARLDGLEPDDLREIVETAIRRHVDTDEHERIREREREEREELRDRLDAALGEVGR